MTLSDTALATLAIGAALLAALALGVAILATRGGPKKDTGPIRMDEALRGILEGHAGKLQRLEHAVRVLNSTDKRQQVLIEGSVRRVSLLRYDAFEDVGGRLSFSCALLDEHGTGVVVTSINGRQETRVYAKPVEAQGSPYNLSTEEAEAIRQAMEGTGPDASAAVDAGAGGGGEETVSA